MKILNCIQIFELVIIQGNRAYIYIFLDIVSNAMTFYFFQLLGVTTDKGFVKLASPRSSLR